MGDTETKKETNMNLADHTWRMMSLDELLDAHKAATRRMALATDEAERTDWEHIVGQYVERIAARGVKVEDIK